MATEEKRIQRIIDNVGNIQDGQICIEPSADGDIGGERLGWKDSHGTTHKALAKDEAARVTTLTATSDVDWPTKANLFDMTSNDTDDLTEGSTNLFLTPTVIADIDALEQYNSDRADATIEFSGFTNSENINVSYSTSTRTVTLTGTFKMYYKGVEVLDISTSWESPAHAASPTTALFLLYDGSFSWSTTPWGFEDVQIAVAEYDASSNFLVCIREVHAFMPWQTHKRLHTAIGTTRESGGDFAGYTLASTTAADRRPTMSECVILDEDLVSTLTAHTSGDNYSYLYLSGASGTPAITVGSADIVGLSGAIPYWNQFTGGAWQQTAMVNNSFMNLWVAAIPTTSDSDSVRNRFLFFAGQTNPTTAAAASSESVNSLNLGLFSGLSPEYIFIQKITLRYTGGNWSWYATERLEGTKTSQTASVSGSWLSSVSSDTTLDGNGTASNPLGVSGSITSTINQLDETRLGMTVDSVVSTVPGSPSEGDRHLVLNSGDGYEDEVIEYRNGAWVEYTPVDGSKIYNLDDRFTYHYQDNAWTRTIDWILKAVTNDGAGTGDTAILSFDGATDYPVIATEGTQGGVNIGRTWNINVELSASQSFSTTDSAVQGCWYFRGILTKYGDSGFNFSTINGILSSSFPVNFTAIHTPGIMDLPTISLSGSTGQVSINVGHTSASAGDVTWIARVKGTVGELGIGALVVS